MKYYISQYRPSGKKNPTKYQSNYTPQYYTPVFAKYRLPESLEAKVSKGKVIVKSRIPAELKRKIEVYARSKEELHRLAHLVVVLFRKFMQKDVKVTELCRSYILMILNGNKDYYRLFTKIVVERMKMVEVIVNKNGTKFSTRNKTCKRYKLNEKYRDRKDFELIFYEQRRPNKINLMKKVKVLPPVLQGVFHTMGRLGLTDNLQNIEKELKGSVDTLREKVRNRTIEMKNGNIHYIKGNEKTIYKKGKFDSLDHFVENKSDELLDSRLNVSVRGATSLEIGSFY